jgi:transglutaminase-like putative cysteine protease
MARTALLASALAAVVTASWARLEQPRPAAGELVVIAALAVVPALVRGRWRILAAAGTGVVAAAVALDVPLRHIWPFDGRDFVGTVADRAWTGFLDFYDVLVPFEGATQPLMHGAMLMAAFTFSLIDALAIAARRPPLALAALLFGAGWPATIYPGQHELARGALILLVGLALLAAVRPGALPLRSQALAAGAVLVVALTLSTSSAVAKTQFVDWQSWDFYNEPDAPVGVSYVWNADYDGVEFPNKRTRVLRVRAPARAGYWRATTLDAFVDDHWEESLIADVDPLGDGEVDDLSSDPLLPPAARDRENWTRAQVRIEALRDQHLVAASVPVAYDTRRIRDDVFYARGGIALAERPLRRGTEYTAWNYAPRPEPQALAASPPEYPFEIIDEGRYLNVESGLSPPPFGVPNRGEWIRDGFAFDRQLRPYEPLYRQAVEVTGEADNPYAAAVALEAWFRTGGGFAYDESPLKTPANVPPLVFFLTQSKEGYCQHYAGAMALMLRYLGIPARVAAGFTSGVYDRDRRVWNVNDRNAHTWVEVWFKGFGWLPFDPTPGRGNLSGTYSSSSFTFDATAARDVLAAAGLGLAGADKLLRFQLARDPGGSSSGEVVPRDFQRAPEAAEEEGGIGRTALVVLTLLGLTALFVVGKLALRRARYLTRDPRRLARAYRRELVEFLADQRIDIPRSATHAEMRELVRTQTGVDLRGLVHSIGLARFGPLTTAAAAAQRARGELRAARRRLRRVLSTGDRLRGAFSVRSLFAR